MNYGGISAEATMIRGANNDEIEAYFAKPAGPGPFPGVVVIHHAPGWDEWTTEVVRKLAHHGMMAVAPHLYHRAGRQILHQGQSRDAGYAAGDL